MPKIDRDWLVKIRLNYIESKPEEFSEKTISEYIMSMYKPRLE
jgi:hypothetical protein